MACNARQMTVAKASLNETRDFLVACQCVPGKAQHDLQSGASLVQLLVHVLFNTS